MGGLVLGIGVKGFDLWAVVKGHRREIAGGHSAFHEPPGRVEFGKAFAGFLGVTTALGPAPEDLQPLRGAEPRPGEYQQPSAGQQAMAITGALVLLHCKLITL